MCLGKRNFIEKVLLKNRNVFPWIHSNQVYEDNLTGIKLSYVTFLSKKSFWVINPTVNDRDTRLCGQHENIAFMIKKFYRVNQVNSGHVSTIIKDASCDETSCDCIFSLCDKCKEISMTVNYIQWQSRTEETLIRGEKKTVKIVKKFLLPALLKNCKLN